MIGKVLRRFRYSAALGTVGMVITQGTLDGASAQIRPGNVIQRGLTEILKQANRDRQAREHDRVRRERQQPSSTEQATPPRPDRLAARPIAADCDRLAGHPSDPMRRGAGIADENIDLVAGLKACAAAVAQNKTEPRLLFQAGRILWLAKEFDEAMPFLLDAAEAKEPAALAYLGDAYANGLGGAEENLETALTFYAQAAEAGYAPASEAADEVAETIAEATPIQQITGTTRTAAELNDCDRLAAHPADPRKVGIGTTDDNIDAGKAIAACEAVRIQFPNTARLDYQYGRALYLADRQSEALPILAGAAENGYAAAKAVIGDAYLEGVGGADQDIGAAYAFYQEAAAGGFKPAASNVAELSRTFAAKAPATGGANKLKLACEVLATRVDNTLEPLQYVNFKFNVSLDFVSNKAIYSGEIPVVDSDMYDPTKQYNFSVGEDDIIRVDYDGFGKEPKYNVLQITMSDGKAYTLSEYRTPNILGWMVANGLMFEGYCGEAPAARPRAQPARSQAARRRR